MVIAEPQLDGTAQAPKRMFDVGRVEYSVILGEYLVGPFWFFGGIMVGATPSWRRLIWRWRLMKRSIIDDPFALQCANGKWHCDRAETKSAKTKTNTDKGGNRQQPDVKSTEGRASSCTKTSMDVKTEATPPRTRGCDVMQY